MLRTPSRRTRPLCSSPHFPSPVAVTTSPYFSRSHPVTSFDVQSDAHESFDEHGDHGSLDDHALDDGPLDEHGFPPYNTYWGALARAAKARPKLIQEEVASDPWKLLVAVMLLNKTAGKVSIPVFRELMTRWPTPSAMAEAPFQSLVELLRPLGLQNVRAHRIIKLSAMYLVDPPSPDRPRRSRVPHYPPTPISHLPGCGRYALDSYRIFCSPDDEWVNVMPTDKELIKYLVTCQSLIPSLTF
ncbi:DNA glycosylase [Ramaria rubella]|nr:DNA glycosylase [Ramaria rubella]